MRASRYSSSTVADRRGQEPRARRAVRARPPAAGPRAAAVERRLPIDRLQRAVDAHHRPRHALGRIHALEAEAVAVRDPGLVDLLVLARHHAHELAAQHVREEVGAEGVVRRDQRLLRHLPGARVIAERLVVERAHRAQIDDVGRQLVIDAVLDVGARSRMCSPRPVVPSSG